MSLTRRLGAALAIALLGCGPTITGGRVDAKDAVTVGIQLHSETFTLPNGLVVVLHREATQHSVYVAVHYDVGSKDDPNGRAGLAHLFEHLMFKAPKHGSGKSVHGLLEEAGTHVNAYTNRDETLYHDTLPPSQLARALWLEADRMAYPAETVDAATLAKERDVVLNEWRERYENQPYGHVHAAAAREVFGPSHPYGLPTIGLPDELRAITLDDVRTFARRYYRPNNATLVICGGFDPKLTRELVEKYFATIPPGPPIPARTFPAARIEKSRTVNIAADVKAPMVVMAWAAPKEHGDGWEPLRIGVDLFEGFARWRLVTSMEIADDVDVDLEGGRLGSMVLVRAKLKPRTDPDSAIGAIERELTDTSRLGTDYHYDRFPDMKTRMVVGTVASLDALDSRAEAVIHGLLFHGVPDAVQDDLRRLQSVHPVDVGGAVEQIVRDRPRITLLVKPTPGAPRAGKVVR